MENFKLIAQVIGALILVAMVGPVAVLLLPVLFFVGVIAVVVFIVNECNKTEGNKS